MDFPAGDARPPRYAGRKSKQRSRAGYLKASAARPAGLRKANAAYGNAATGSNDDDLRRHVDYIHYNLVKHGHVRNVKEWPHSTFHRYVRHGVYSNDWAGDGFDMEHDAGERIS